MTDLSAIVARLRRHGLAGGLLAVLILAAVALLTVFDNKPAPQDVQQPCESETLFQ